MSGHQATVWHPGILAKDLAAVGLARRVNGYAVHLVVDQDEHPVWRLQVPRREGDRWRAAVVNMGRSGEPGDGHPRALGTGAGEVAGVPTGMQPPVALRRSGVGVLDEVVADASAADWRGARTLAQQATVVLDGLRRRLVDRPIACVFTSQLAQSESFRELVEHMVRDPRRCARRYNAAVSPVPRAGLAPMGVTVDRVELPLWSCRWMRPRQRVYADPAPGSSGGWRLVDSDGRAVDAADLRPRALAMTGLVREALAAGGGLFVHGAGGWVYDRATERWWDQWRERELAPMAMASADMRLELEGPRATRGDVARAVWWKHHLPHNVDRALSGQVPEASAAAGLGGRDAELAGQKAGLLRAMGADRDAQRRAGLWRELRAVNRELAERHPALLAEAKARVERVRVGLANAAVASRRDWPMACYPAGALRALRDRIERGVAAGDEPAEGAVNGRAKPGG
jgi:hypothetical protein